MAAYPGACLCGAVRFEIEPPTKWCAHCHCTMCQRGHGAAFVTWVGVPKAQLRLVGGDDSLEWYRSSPDSRRGFCRRCGSSMFFESERWSEEIHVVRANIPGEIDRAPGGHAYFVLLLCGTPGEVRSAQVFGQQLRKNPSWCLPLLGNPSGHLSADGA